MAEKRKILGWLNPLGRTGAKRLERYLETEGHEWMDAVERQRKDRDEKEHQIDLALHREQREASNWLQNREMRMTDMVLEYERTLIAIRIDIRKRLALECPELLSDGQLSILKESMLRSLQMARLARRDDYERRARAVGVPILPANQRDAAQYGDLDALVVREVRQIELARTLRRMGKAARWTREEKLKLAAWVVPPLLALIALLVNIAGIERLRHWLRLGP